MLFYVLSIRIEGEERKVCSYHLDPFHDATLVFPDCIVTEGETLQLMEVYVQSRKRVMILILVCRDESGVEL